MPPASTDWSRGSGDSGDSGEFGAPTIHGTSRPMTAPAGPPAGAATQQLMTPASAGATSDATDDGWNAAGPRSKGTWDPNSFNRGSGSAAVDSPAPSTTTMAASDPAGSRAKRVRTAQTERGLPGWQALLVLIVIAIIGDVIDKIDGSTTGTAFNWGIVVASLIAILIVRRSSMFPIVVAPPLVYFLLSGAKLYVNAGTNDDRKVIIDAAANWLVYGFPAIAGATAAVLIVTGIRLITRR
jgi:hypothetical protein